MRRLIAAVLVLAAGCGGRAASGPAWPESAGTEVDPEKVAEDGGESLEPRKESVASVEASTEIEPEPAPVVTPAATETKTDFTSATPPSTTTPPPATGEDPPIVEEIVIEISD